LASIRLTSDSMFDSIDAASVAVTIRRQGLARLDPVYDMFGSRAHQHVTDLVDLGDDLLVQVDEPSTRIT
jgi:hypothetical protein